MHYEIYGNNIHITSCLVVLCYNESVHILGLYTMTQYIFMDVIPYPFEFCRPILELQLYNYNLNDQPIGWELVYMIAITLFY